MLKLYHDRQILTFAPSDEIAKVANRYCWQILLKFMPEVLPNVPSLEELRMLVNSKAVRIAINVAPLTIL